MGALADLIASATNLKFLKLKGNKIGDEGVKALCKSLLGSSVHTLDLGYNAITWEGVTYIMTLVSTNRKIRVLNLKKNNINQKLFTKLVNDFKSLNVVVEL